MLKYQKYLYGYKDAIGMDLSGNSNNNNDDGKESSRHGSFENLFIYLIENVFLDSIVD